MNADTRAAAVDLDNLSFDGLCTLRQRLEEELARRGRASASPSARRRSELRDLLVFALGSTYLVLAVAGFLYGVSVGGEPPADPSPLFVPVGLSVGSGWMLGVLTMWICMRSR